MNMIITINAYTIFVTILWKTGMTWLTISTVALYIVAWCSLFFSIMLKLNIKSSHIKIGLCLTVALHFVLAFTSITTQNGVDLGFFKVALLLFAVINGLLLASSMKKSVLPLFLLLLPLSIIGLVAHMIFGSDSLHLINLSAGLTLHILTSILAYSLLTIATIQSILLAYQEYQLKHHSAGKILRVLPALQTMDNLLFEVIWLGFVLLCVSIVSGIIFIDDIFAQQLAHKTVFSVLSLIIYGVLLWGRHRFGWRGIGAIKWVLSGFCLLMIAYFGTKFVVELVLETA